MCLACPFPVVLHIVPVEYTRVGLKIHMLTKKELCHSNENWHALNATFPDILTAVVFFHAYIPTLDK